MKLFSLLSLICFSFISLNSFAVDMSGRKAIGLGLKGLSFKSFSSETFALSAHLLVFRSEEGGTVCAFVCDDDDPCPLGCNRDEYAEAEPGKKVLAFITHLKADCIFSLKENMNFYWSVVGGYGSHSLFFKHVTNIKEFQFLMGTEFFKNSIGVTMEAGVSAAARDVRQGLPWRRVLTVPLITSTIYYYF